MDLFEKPYYSCNKNLLSIIGHWPHQSTWKKRLHQTLIILCLLTIIIPELIKLFEVWGDLETVFECIPPLGLHAINIVKWINCVVNIDKLTKLITHMELDWKSRTEENGSHTLRKYAERGRVLTIFYTYYMFISAALYVCVPLIPLILDIVKPLDEMRPREFLFRTEYFVDQNHFFVPIFFHALVTTFTSVTIVSAVDTMYGAYIHYACAVFTELCQDLENGLDNNHESLNVSNIDDHTYHRIVQCVNKHKKIIKFCELLESTYTIYFLIIIGINIVLISFTGVQTVMRLMDLKLTIRYGSYILGQIIHVFFCCWHGQLLIDHSLQINHAIYNSKWYISSLRSRRVLRIMMTRSINPCQLSTGKIFSVRLDTFSIIIKSAISYFTVLRSLH